MGTRSGAAYSLDMCDPLQIRDYKEELYDDQDVIVDKTACGTTLSIGATAAMVASWMTWMYINRMMRKDYVNEVMFSIDPVFVTSRKFNCSDFSF